jgi:hypothetical protein
MNKPQNEKDGPMMRRYRRMEALLPKIRAELDRTFPVERPSEWPLARECQPEFLIRLAQGQRLSVEVRSDRP